MKVSYLLKNNLRIKNIFLIHIIFFLSLPCLHSQVPDDINGRLWRLCKTWGYLKYFHENQCSVDWNKELLSTIDSTLHSTSTASFNTMLKALIDKAGTITHAADSLTINSDINLNARFEWMHDPFLGQQVQNDLDSILVNFRPRVNCFVKMTEGYIDLSNDFVQLDDHGYGNEANRMLVFFSYWNIINYFYPYRYLMDVDWDSTLYHFIPVFLQASNDQDFHLRFLDLVTQIDDTHGYTYSPVLSAITGDHFPLLGISFIEGKCVITKIHSTISGISVGDILLKVDGIDIKHFRDSLSHFTAASNEPTLNRNIARLLLRGQFSSLAQLELENSAGIVYSKSIKRLYSTSTYSQFNSDTNHTVWKITDCGYGYVNMANLYPNQLDQMYTDLKHTPAIIFDIRNYPNGVIWSLIPYLYPSPITFALFTRQDPTYPGWFNWDSNIADLDSFSNPDPYAGKVIILVNEVTQSHAEYTAMGLQQHPNAYTIGSQTAGADGNVVGMFLPGGLYTLWTGLGVYYPDTVSAQRAGIRIDSIVTPTIKGIREGRDEVLEAALDCLINSSDQKDLRIVSQPEINIFPNPVTQDLHFTFTSDWTGYFTASVLNITGQTVARRTLIKSSPTQEFNLDIASCSSGNYILKVESELFVYSKNLIID